MTARGGVASLVICKKGFITMKRLAIIPARGGSKRIPRKNIKEFCGKPIIVYSIDAALKSGIFDEVMVSTEDTEIAEIAKKYGASVPFMRSEKASRDTAIDAEVIAEVFEEYAKRGEFFDEFAYVYPCAPFVTAQDLKNGIDLLETTEADWIIPLARLGYPPQRGYVIRDGSVEHMFPQYSRCRTQDLEPVYRYAGSFTMYKTEIYFGRSIGSGKCFPIMVEDELCQDIDNESDWEMAELKYKVFVQKLEL